MSTQKDSIITSILSSPFPRKERPGRELQSPRLVVFASRKLPFPFDQSDELPHRFFFPISFLITVAQMDTSKEQKACIFSIISLGWHAEAHKQCTIDAWFQKISTVNGKLERVIVSPDSAT